MAKNYVNGYDRFRIRIRWLSHGEWFTKTFNFSFKYEALTEYYEKITTLHKFITGSKKKLCHYIEYEWRIFYTDRIDKEDLLKLTEIENIEFAEQYEIFLTPHIDKLKREFAVLILDEKRTIELFPHFRGLENTPNKGFEISFVNRDAIQQVNMLDPDEIVIGGTVDAPYEGQVEE